MCELKITCNREEMKVENEHDELFNAFQMNFNLKIEFSICQPSTSTNLSNCALKSDFPWQINMVCNVSRFNLFESCKEFVFALIYVYHNIFSALWKMDLNARQVFLMNEKKNQHLVCII